jgi:20S proteasome alpha/beta subunit
MTIIVGVLCKDGVVVGADSAATFAAGQVRTIEQRTKKMEIVSEHVIVAGSGEVGLTQRFTAVVEAAWKGGAFTKTPIEVGKYLSAETIKDFLSTNAPRALCALVAFPCNGKPLLCEFSVDHFQPELKTERLWYVSLGSGQAIADPFLGFIREVMWHDGLPSTREAAFAVTWTLSHAIKLNPGGINGPIQIATLAYDKGKLTARELTEEEVELHQQSVDGAIAHLRQYRETLRGNNSASVPDIPKPAAVA